MGAKITIDSATLMNKGFEAIEAHWLFGLPSSKIEIVIHPQSIIHSLVQFEDGSIKAQLGLPDMRLPIQYALTFPYRIKNNFPRFSFLDYPELNFSQPDTKIFRNLALAYKAMNKGGNIPCVLNAANEVAVQAFLEKKITFLQITDIIEQVIDGVSFVGNPTMDDLSQTNTEARKKAQLLTENRK
jgi:1-deoxy-D-xylulose-5-phosphate reductoisomerase